MSKEIKIGIYGPKPIFLGGHDADNDQRSYVYEEIEKIVSFYKQDRVVGLTGLSLGVEQDFANICINYKIPYNCYLPFPNPEKYWKNLSDQVKNDFLYFLSQAKEKITLAKGNYSPKKILNKNIRIINESDIMIVVTSELFPLNNEQLLKLLKMKKVYYINV